MNVTVLAHNLMAMNGNRQLNMNTKSKARSAERLASGYRINRAGDDAAGLSISEKMRQQIRGLDRGEQNTQDGVSFCQTADGAMNEVHDLLNRMQLLSVQAANDTNSQQEKSSIQHEINQIKLEINRISNTTTFNERPVFYDVDQEPTISEPVIDDTANNGAVNNGIVQNTPSVQPGACFGDQLQIVSLLNRTGTFCAVGAPTEGLPGYSGELNKKYAAAMIDFNDPNGEYYAGDLIGKNICVVDTDSDKKYNIELGDSRATGGRAYKADVAANKLIVNVAGLGATYVTNVLISSIKDMPGYTQGNIQFAADSHGKFWIYDNRSANLDNCPLRWGKESDFVVQPQVQPPAQQPMQPSTQNSAQDSVTDEPKNSGKIWIQAGADGRSGMLIEQPQMSVKKLGLDEIDVESPGGALKAIDILDRAREIVSSERSMIGAQQNRLEHMMNINANTSENLTHAESVIRDTDMAEEMVSFMKHNVLEQAGQSMLAQANQLPQQVLSLLQ